MNEHIRKSILEYLVLRLTAAYTAAQVARMVNLHRMLEDEIDAKDANAALVYLEGLGFVRSFYGEMGGEKNWQATTRGVQYHERGEA